MAEVYLDHNVDRSVSYFLRRRGHGARTVSDLGMESAGDEELLLLSSQRGWVFVTHDKKDFRMLHRAWILWSRAWNVTSEHAGILRVPEGPADVTAERVDSLLRAESNLRNQLLEWRSGTWIRGDGT